MAGQAYGPAAYRIHRGRGAERERCWPGLANLGASAFNSSIVTPQAAFANDQFESEDQRRLRILQQYFTARAAILRTSQLLVSWGAAEQLRNTHGNDYKVCDEWLEKLGRQVVSKQNAKDAEAVNQCIRAVNDRWSTLDNGFAWDVSESIRDAAAEKWVTAQITELVHILHIALLHADLYTEQFLPAATIELWFASMADKFFFANLSLVSDTKGVADKYLILVPSLHS